MEVPQLVDLDRGVAAACRQGGLIRTVIVEDEAVARSRLARFLGGHTDIGIVGEAATGAEAIELIERTAPDLVILDVMMPKKNGFAFAREVRKTDQRTPLIFLTAKSLKEDRIEGFRIGCDDYVTKPFSMEELMLRIRAVLKRARAATEPELSTEPIPVGKYLFDHGRQMLQFKEEKKKLTSREADLLRLLCLHMNNVLERDEALRLQRPLRRRHDRRRRRTAAHRSAAA